MWGDGQEGMDGLGSAGMGSMDGVGWDVVRGTDGMGGMRSMGPWGGICWDGVSLLPSVLVSPCPGS